MIRDFLKKLPLARLGMGWCLFLTLPLAALETLLALYIQPGSLKTLCVYLMGQPLLAFLNFLPFWLLTLAFYFLFSNPFFSAAFVGSVGGILSIVNRTMIEKRDEPLSPKDLALIKEAGDAAQSYDLNIAPGVLWAVIGFAAAMLLLGIFFRAKFPFRKRWQNICFRLACCGSFLGILVGCVNQVYNSKELYTWSAVSTRYTIPRNCIILSL